VAGEHQEKGRLLTALARASIAAGFGLPRPDLPRPAWLEEPAATFVTLTIRGELRGCIGSIEPHRSLHDDVARNARAAAWEDPRFPPLTAGEWPAVRVEVSVLNEPQPYPFRSEADALSRLRPGIDGVILEYRGRRALFLPQAWEHLPDAREFLAHLKQKAGLPADLWNDDLRLSVFQVEAYHES
jgi:hypothetical protein